MIDIADIPVKAQSHIRDARSAHRKKNKTNASLCVQLLSEWFESHFSKNCSLRNFGNSVYPACQCLSDETVKAVGPFYLVSMPGVVKDPTSPHWNV